MYRFFAAAIAALSLSAVSANALTSLSFSDSTSSTGPVTLNSDRSYSDSFNLQQFDPSLGTLQSITLQTDFTIQQYGVSSQIPGTVTGETGFLGGDFDFRLRTVGRVTHQGVSQAVSNIEAHSCSGTVFVTSDCSADVTGLFQQSRVTTLTGSLMNNWIGLGQVRPAFTFEGFQILTPVGTPVSAEFFGRVLAVSTVTYSYEEPALAANPVPLPASFPFLLGGLGGLALMRRRGR